MFLWQKVVLKLGLDDSNKSKQKAMKAVSGLSGTEIYLLVTLL